MRKFKYVDVRNFQEEPEASNSIQQWCRNPEEKYEFSPSKFL